MYIDKAPEGGKFRATAAAALDGTAGAWGDLDLLCVTFDGSGDIIVAAATTAMGIIWTPEGKKDKTAANYKDVVGGNVYTVFMQCELDEAGTGTSPALSAGDNIFAAAAGDVTTAGAAGTKWIGMVLGSGERAIVNVGLMNDGT